MALDQQHKALTIKQEKFCLKYIECGNATEAYKSAYDAENMKDNTIRRKAYELLSKDYIGATVDTLRKEARERAMITVEQIVKSMANVVLINVSDFYKDDGTVKKLSELTEAQRNGLAYYSVKSIPIGGGRTEEVPVFKTHDVEKNKDMLMRYFGAYNKDKTQVPTIINVGIE